MLDDDKDIIDEAIFYFKPLIFYKNYEIKSEADRVLIYLVLYIIECLKRLQKCTSKTIGIKELTAMGIERFDIPGDPSFPRELGSMYAKPRTSEETDTMRQYIQQLRQEMGVRLIDKVFPNESQPPSKWWLCFSRRKFLDQALSVPGKYK